MITWLKKNKELLTILIALLPIIWSVTAFFIETNKKLERQRFELYHNAISGAVGAVENKMAASQRALIYELRFFEEYKDITCRELNHLLVQLTQPETLIEIKLTQKFLDCPAQIE